MRCRGYPTRLSSGGHGPRFSLSASASCGARGVKGSVRLLERSTAAATPPGDSGRAHCIPHAGPLEHVHVLGMCKPCPYHPFGTQARTHGGDSARGRRHARSCDLRSRSGRGPFHCNCSERPLAPQSLRWHRGCTRPSVQPRSIARCCVHKNSTVSRWSSPFDRCKEGRSLGSSGCLGR